jgi:hypothetical protein
MTAVDHRRVVPSAPSKRSALAAIIRYVDPGANQESTNPELESIGSAA